MTLGAATLNLQNPIGVASPRAPSGRRAETPLIRRPTLRFSRTRNHSCFPFLGVRGS